MTDRLTNSLTAIADDLRRESEACDKAERAAIGHAMTAGRMLCEAKEECEHGQWLPFLKRAGMSERKAQRWMKLHRGRLNPDTVSLLGGVTPALSFLASRDRAMGYLDLAEAAAIRSDAGGEVTKEELLQPLELAIATMMAMGLDLEQAEHDRKDSQSKTVGAVHFAAEETAR